MKHFTIENETHCIAVHASAKRAEATAHSERFSSETGLAKLTADWPMARLTELWNSLPGVTQVKKFTDRATAVARIWKAIQQLEINASESVAAAAVVANGAAPQGRRRARRAGAGA